VAVLTFVVLEVQLGVGEHFGNPHLMMNYGQIVHWSYHHAWILIIGITCVKLSVGIFLLRLIQGKLYRASSSWQRSMLNSNVSTAVHHRVDGFPARFHFRLRLYTVSLSTQLPSGIDRNTDPHFLGYSNASQSKQRGTLI